MTGRTSKADARRDEILKAAGACLSEKGLRGASINDICRALNISPGHLYYYFKSKDAIIEALLDQLREAQLVDIERELTSGEGVVDFFMSGDYMARTEAPAGVYLTETTVWELYAEAARQPCGPIAQLVHAQWNAADRLIASRIRASKLAGQLRADADVEIVRTLMCMAVVTAQTARFGDPDFDPQRYKAATRQMLTPFIDPAYAKAGAKTARRSA